METAEYSVSSSDVGTSQCGKSHFCAQTLRAAADEECAGLYEIVFRVADLRGGVQVAWIKNKGVAAGEQAQDEKGLLII